MCRWPVTSTIANPIDPGNRNVPCSAAHGVPAASTAGAPFLHLGAPTPGCGHRDSEAFRTARSGRALCCSSGMSEMLCVHVATVRPPSAGQRGIGRSLAASIRVGIRSRCSVRWWISRPPSVRLGMRIIMGARVALSYSVHLPHTAHSSPRKNTHPMIQIRLTIYCLKTRWVGSTHDRFPRYASHDRPTGQ
jgi:hypothetical protein